MKHYIFIWALFPFLLALTACWDDKAAMRGEEKPVKQSDHSLDALRYRVNGLPDWRFE